MEPVQASLLFKPSTLLNITAYRVGRYRNTPGIDAIIICVENLEDGLSRDRVADVKGQPAQDAPASQGDRLIEGAPTPGAL